MATQPISDAEILACVETAAPHSDDEAWLLEWYAHEFVQSHRAAPLGPSLEVGTRAGGSAYLWLLLLRHLYGADGSPMVFTVDPYGDRPYHDGVQMGRYFYGPSLYVAQKQLLAAFPNHAHFLMTSNDFLTIATDPRFHLRYWRNGQPRQYRGFSFAYLDGEHDHSSILSELAFLYGIRGLMLPGARVCIDNVNWDPQTIPMLGDGGYQFTLNDQKTSAVVTGWLAEEALTKLTTLLAE